MERKIKRNYLILIFVFFMSVFLFNVLHKKAEFSENENRTLAQYESPSVSTLTDGTFMENFENYASDQFIMRDGFISLKAFFERIQGKRENNGVIFADNDYLIAKPEPYNKKIIDNNLNSIIEFSDIGRYDITLAVIPTAFEICSDYLPKGAYSDEIPRLNAEIEIIMSGHKVKIANTEEILKNHKDEYLYFRTDHHQTALGSYLVYSQLGSFLDFQHYDKGDFNTETLSDEFFGTNWSKAKVMGIDGDKIFSYKLEGEHNYFVEFPLEGKSMDGLYSMEHLKTKDKYSVFLDGNHALSVIKSDCGVQKRLAVIKDSYAHSIVPFLANHYSEIHMIDLRYYNDDVVKYLYENGIKDVLILYNSSNFMSDTNLEKLGLCAKTSDYANISYGRVEGTEPVTNEYFDDAIFLGDSLTMGMSLYSGLNSRFYCSTGMSIHGIDSAPLNSGYTIIDSVFFAENVSKFYMLFGINEIGGSKEEFVRLYGEAIDTIKSLKPSAAIYVQGILPVSEKREQQGDILNKDINETNVMLEKMAEEKEVYYVEPGEVLRDENGFLKADITIDGIHLTPEGYGVWVDYLKNHAVSDGKVYTKPGENSEEIEFPDSTVDVRKIGDELCENVKFKDNLSMINPKLMSILYGIEPSEVQNGVIYMGGGATAEEIAIFEVKNAKEAEKIESKMNTRVENKKRDFENYIPQEMTKLNKPLILKSDKIIALCISDDNSAAEKILKKYIK